MLIIISSIANILAKMDYIPFSKHTPDFLVSAIICAITSKIPFLSLISFFCGAYELEIYSQFTQMWDKIIYFVFYWFVVSISPTQWLSKKESA